VVADTATNILFPYATELHSEMSGDDLIFQPLIGVSTSSGLSLSIVTTVDVDPPLSEPLVNADVVVNVDTYDVTLNFVLGRLTMLA
jgi:hypothetical protein